MVKTSVKQTILHFLGAGNPAFVLMRLDTVLPNSDAGKNTSAETTMASPLIIIRASSSPNKQSRENVTQITLAGLDIHRETTSFGRDNSSSSKAIS